MSCTTVVCAGAATSRRLRHAGAPRQPLTDLRSSTGRGAPYRRTTRRVGTASTGRLEGGRPKRGGRRSPSGFAIVRKSLLDESPAAARGTSARDDVAFFRTRSACPRGDELAAADPRARGARDLWALHVAGPEAASRLRSSAPVPGGGEPRSSIGARPPPGRPKKTSPWTPRGPGTLKTRLSGLRA